MAFYIKGDAISNASYYELYENITAGSKLLNSIKIDFVDGKAPSGTSSSLQDASTYYTYTVGAIPNATYTFQPYGRVWTCDADMNGLRTIKLETTNTLSIESGEAFIIIAYKKANVEVSDASVTIELGDSDKQYIAKNTEINFNLSNISFGTGSHSLVVKAKADGIEDSDYSNVVTYTAE